MSVVDAVLDVFTAGRKAEDKRRLTVLEQYAADVVDLANGGQKRRPADIAGNMADAGKVDKDLKSDVLTVQGRQEKAKLGARTEALEQATAEIGDKLRALENAQAAAIREYESTYARLANELAMKSRELDGALHARAEIVRTSPRAAEFRQARERLEALRRDAGSAEQIASLRMTAAAHRQRALEVANSPDIQAGQIASQSRQAAEAADREADRIQKQLGSLKRQEQQLQAELTAFESECIQSAIVGELPIDPAAQPVEKTGGRVIRINM